MPSIGGTTKTTASFPRRLVGFICGDAFIGGLVFVGAFVFALTFLSRSGVSGFYEVYFAPAVNFACTGNFQELDHDASPLAPLKQFVDRKAETFDCATIPHDLSPYVRATDVVQDATVYLIALAGLIWRCFGVSWAALVPLGAALVAGFALSLYALSRLFVGRWLALFVVAMVMISPLHLSMMPALRDYSKAPFITGSVFLIGAALLAETRTRLIACAILAGAVAGLGLGFRSDAALVVPFFAIAVVVGAIFAREKPRSAFAVAFAGFAAAYVIAGAVPLVAGVRHGGIFGHVALLGLTTPFNEPLGVTAMFYDIGSLYSDRAVTQFVNGFESFRQQSSWPDLAFNAPPYNRAAIDAYLTYALNFPADILVRSYASIIRVVNIALPADGPARLWPLIALRNLLTAAGAKPLIVMGALTIFAAYRRGAAMFLCFAIIWFAGAVSIQFQTRHAFHLEYIYWLALALLVSAFAEILRGDGDVRARIQRLRDWRAFLPAGLLACMALGLVLVRAYQSPHVAALMARYESAPRLPIETDRRTQDADTIIAPVGLIPDFGGVRETFSRDRTAQYYLVALIDPAQCGGETISLTAQYRVKPELIGALPTSDFTRHLDIPRAPSRGEVRIFLPVSVTPASAFEGFRMRSDQAGCLRNVEAVAQTDRLPLPLWIVLDKNWRAAPRYQKLARF